MEHNDIDNIKDDEVLTKGGSTVLTFFSSLLQQPYMRVSREDFLKETFRDFPNLDKILDLGPVKAEVSRSTLRELAEGVKKHHRNKATVLSTIAGIPGGPAMLVSVPTDIIQLLANWLLGAQKIAYLYNYNFDHEHCSDEEKNVFFMAVLTIMVGQGAGNVGEKIIRSYGEAVAKNVASRLVFKAPIHKLVNTVAVKIGVGQVGKRTLSKTIIMGIPVVSGIINGIITYIASNKAFNNIISFIDKYIYEPKYRL